MSGSASGECVCLRWGRAVLPRRAFETKGSSFECEGEVENTSSLFVERAELLSWLLLCVWELAAAYCVEPAGSESPPVVFDNLSEFGRLLLLEVSGLRLLLLWGDFCLDGLLGFKIPGEDVESFDDSLGGVSRLGVLSFISFGSWWMLSPLTLGFCPPTVETHTQKKKRHS